MDMELLGIGTTILVLTGIIILTRSRTAFGSLPKSQFWLEVGAYLILAAIGFIAAFQ